MPRLSFLFRTDVHINDTSPVSWKQGASYPEEIWSNLDQIGLLASKHEVNAVLDGGDFFHSKAAIRTSHATILRTAKTHRAYQVRGKEIPTYTVAGNHDLYGNDLGSLERQPLGVLYGCGVFNVLDSVVFEDGDMRVRIVGVPYNPKRTVEELLSIQKQPGDDYLVAVIHGLATKKPTARLDEIFNEPVFRYGDLISQDGPDVFMFGHWHKDQGIEQIGGKWFVNQGALSRGSLTHENLNRTPQAALLTFDGKIEVTTLPMVVAPASEVFDLERKERNDTEMVHIQEFVEALQRDEKFRPELTIEDNINSMGAEFSIEVAQTALRLLAEARGVG